MSIFNYIFFCLLAIHQCQIGQSRVSDRMRIVGGELAEVAEIKYVVVTLHDDKYYSCGGGIIDNYWVLSAAHCYIDDKDEFGDKKIKVVAGVIDYHDLEDPRRVEVEVEKIFIPEAYHSDQLVEDIALLKLKKSLDIVKHDLQKLSLPPKDRNLDNRMALMAGFGYDKHRKYFNFRTRQVDEEGSASGLLRKADIQMYSNKQCQNLYREDKIHDYYLCGKMLKDSPKKEYGVCNGDSGSPLVFNSTEVVGVVSWSYGCDERDVPLVYTRVSSFLDFIDNAKKGKTKGMRVRIFK